MMNRSQHPRTAIDRARRPLLDAIEWEPLPSLAGTLRRGTFPSGPAWTSTQPMALDPLAPRSTPTEFDEPIDGLQVRELEGPTLFGHLFD
jgi:hypothetical protein